jgi:plastocyanin
MFSNPPPRATDFRWSLSGPEAIRARTGAVGILIRTIRSAGTELVQVSFTTGGRQESVRLVVHVRAARAKSGKVRPTQAHTSSAATVTITDFKFGPATITVHVGDTVTWTNSSPMPHSATADNNSFDTGIVKPGASASHTFTQAGTFTYHCNVHPFMHGTVIVLATVATTPTTTTTTPPAASFGGLPMTGTDLITGLLVGLAMLGGGVALRQAAKRG